MMIGPSPFDRITIFNLQRTRIMSLAAILMLGCGQGMLSGPVPIKGKVTYNGTPVDQGVITFIPVSSRAGKEVEANLKSGGEFQVEDGILPAEYYITVQSPPGAHEKSKSVLPKRFSDRKGSGLVETITSASGQRPLELNLTDAQ